MTTFRNPLRFAAETLRLTVRNLPVVAVAAFVPKAVDTAVVAAAIRTGIYDPYLYAATGGAAATHLAVRVAVAAVTFAAVVWTAGFAVAALVSDAATRTRVPARTAAMVAVRRWPKVAAVMAAVAAAGAVAAAAVRAAGAGARVGAVTVAAVTAVTVAAAAPLLGAAAAGPDRPGTFTGAVTHVRSDAAALLTRIVPPVLSAWAAVTVPVVVWAAAGPLPAAVVTAVTWAGGVPVAVWYATVAVAHIDGAYLIDRRLTHPARTADTATSRS